MATSQGQAGRQPQEADGGPAIGMPTKRQKVSGEGAAVHGKLENGGMCPRRSMGKRNRPTEAVSRQTSSAEPASPCTTPKSSVPVPRQKDSDQQLGGEEHSIFRKDQSLQVIIRTRPLGSVQIAAQGQARCVRQDSDNALTWLGHPEVQFTFDYVACESITQQRFFFLAGLPMIDNCISGYNCSLFTYGETGSGKTHTMIGDLGDLDSRSSSRGLIPRMFNYLFARIRQDQESRSLEHLQYCCKCSYLEIHGDEMRDLLRPMFGNLQKGDPERRINVENLTGVEVSGVPDVIQLLLQGSPSKKGGATIVDGEIESHCVFTCLIESKWESDSIINTKRVRLNLVELADSDRERTLGAGECLNISKSLSTLGIVLPILLGKGPRTIPSHHSMLTHFLQDSVGDHSKVTLVANVKPSVCSAIKTLSTLRFAQSAKSILNNDAVEDFASSDSPSQSDVDTSKELAAAQAEVIRLKTNLFSVNSQKERERDDRRKLSKELDDAKQTAKDKLLEAASVMKALLAENQKLKSDAESWHTETVRLSRAQEKYKTQLGVAEEKVNTAFTSLMMAHSSSEEEVVSGTAKAEASSYLKGTAEVPMPKQADNLTLSDIIWTHKLEILLNRLNEALSSVSLLEADRDTAKVERSTVENEAQIAAMETLERHRLELEHMQSLGSISSCEVKRLEEKLRQVEHEAKASCKQLEEAHKKIDDARKQHEFVLADTKRAGLLRLERLQFELEEARSLVKKRTSEVEKLEQKLALQEHDLHKLLQEAQVKSDDAKVVLESERSQLCAEVERLKAAIIMAENEAKTRIEKLSAAQAQVEDLNKTLASVQASMMQKESEWEETNHSLKSELEERLASFSQQEKKWAEGRKNQELELQQLQLEAIRAKDTFAFLTRELEMAKASLLEAESAHKQDLVLVEKDKQVFVSKFNSTQEKCTALDLEVQRVTSLYTGLEEQLSKTKDDWRKDREQILAASKAKEVASKKSSEVQQLEGKIGQLELSLRGAREELDDTAEVWESEKSQLSLQLEHFKAATSTTRNEAIVLGDKLLATQGELKDLGKTLVAVQAKSTGRERKWQEEVATLNLRLEQGELNGNRLKDEAAALQARVASLNAELDISKSCLAQAKDLHHQGLVSWDEEKQNLLSTLRVANLENERCSGLELEVQRLKSLLAGLEHRLSKSEDGWTKDRVQLEAARSALASTTESANERTSEAHVLKKKVALLEHDVLDVTNLLRGVEEDMEKKTEVWKYERAQLSHELEQFKARVTTLSAELELLRTSSANAKQAHEQVLLIREREKQNLLYRLDAAQDVSSGLELELKRVTSLFAETEQRLLEAQVTWMKEREPLMLELAERNALICTKLSECNQLKGEVTRYESYMSNLHAMLLAAKKSNRVKDTKWNEERARLSLQLQQAELDKTRTMDEVSLLLSRVESLEGELETLKGSEHHPEQDMAEAGLEREKERLKRLAAGIKDYGPEAQTEAEHIQRTRQEILEIEARIRKLEEKHHSKSTTPSKKVARTSMHLSTTPSTTSSICPLSFHQEEIIVLDSHFHVFDNDRTEKEISPNQIWAIYEEQDGMPRRYGQILEVTFSPFKAVMRWLVPILSKQGKAWVAFSGMALSCGDFWLGKQKIIDTVNILSHVMVANEGTNVVRIFPRKHDVWALYQTSDNKWPDARKEGGKQAWYDIVEVMNDFSEEAGVVVAPLSKVSGFRTLFQQSLSIDETYCTKDLLRFSHKVPAYRMSGDEAAGVPKNCLELDPASIPLDMICR